MADAAWQEAWVEVLPDFSNFRDKADRQIVKHLSGAGDRGGVAGARSFGNSFSGGIGRLAGPIGAAVASLGIGFMVGDAIRSGIDWVGEGIALASDLAESVNAVKVSYGEAGEAILALGADSADTMALTRAELNSSAVQFSNFSKTIAGAGGDAAGVFETIAKRGVDFASVLNLEVSDALTLFQSGLAGETEPLRRYGIDLSAAAVKTYALANGIGSATGELSEAEKVQARYGLLLQKTDQYSGDFAATSDGLANSQRRLNASLRETQTSAGEIFLPLMTELANVANDELVPALRDVVAEAGPELASALADSVPALIDFAKAVIPLLPQLVEMGVKALPLLIKGGELLIPILTWLTEDTTGWFTAVDQVFRLLSGDTTLGAFVAKLQETGGRIGWLVSTTQSAVVSVFHFFASIRDGATRATVWLGARVSEMIAFVRSLPARAAAAVGDLGRTLFRSGQALIGGFISGISSMLRPAGDAVAGVLNWVQGFFPNSPAERGPLSGSGWNELAKSGEAVMTQFTSGFARPDLTGRLSPVLGAVTPAVRASVSAGEGSAPGSTGPATFNLYDADGVLMGSMRGQIAAASAARERADRRGKQVV